MHLLLKIPEKKRPLVVINVYLERQADFSRPPVVPGTNLFSEASLPSRGQRDILIFTDSIPKGICTRELNNFIKKWQSKNGICPWSNIKRNFTLFRCSPYQFLT